MNSVETAAEPASNIEGLARSIGQVVSELPTVSVYDALNSLLLSQQAMEDTIGEHLPEALHSLQDSTAAAAEKLQQAGEKLSLAGRALRHYLSLIGSADTSPAPDGSAVLSGCRLPSAGSKHHSDPSLYTAQARMGALANNLNWSRMVRQLQGHGAEILTGRVPLPASVNMGQTLDQTEIDLRTQILRAYDPLAPVVDIILSTPDEDLPGNIRYLDAGNNRKVYVYTDSTGNQTAIKIPINSGLKLEDRMLGVEGQVCSLIRLKGHPRFERLQALSYTDDAIATNYLPYPPISRLDEQQIRAIPEEHVEQFARDLLWARDNKVVPDMIGENILYDAMSGFYIIDPCGIDIFDIGDLKTYGVLNRAAYQLSGLFGSGQSRRQAAARVRLVQAFAKSLDRKQRSKSNIKDVISRLQDVARDQRIRSRYNLPSP